MIPSELLHSLIGLVLAMVLQRFGLPPFQWSNRSLHVPNDLNTCVRAALLKLLHEVNATEPKVTQAPSEAQPR